MRVAVLGECMVEIRHLDAEFARFSFGGDVLNTAIYLTRLGFPTRFVTALGDDRYSERMLAAWSYEGVKTDAVRIVPGRLPGMYVIETSPDGERRFLYWRTDSPARDVFTAANAEETTKALIDTDVLFLSGITLSLYGEAGLWRLFAALKMAHRKGVKIVFDTNFRPRNWPDLSIARAAFAELADVVDIVLAGDEDTLHLFGGNDAEAALRDWLDFESTEVVLKCGSRDCRIWADGATFAAAPERVDKVVDTTAAGDSFAAAYLAARLHGAAPDVAARAGHRLAAVVICHPGAIIPKSAMPSLVLAAS
ncbi:MAG: sugar kinase [Ancalomicrobiaceae bacterium]|nr:sugar kinase [Ancalomicrobiaceae bacterium]